MSVVKPKQFQTALKRKNPYMHPNKIKKTFKDIPQEYPQPIIGPIPSPPRPYSPPRLISHPGVKFQTLSGFVPVLPIPQQHDEEIKGHSIEWVGNEHIEVSFQTKKFVPVLYSTLKTSKQINENKTISSNGLATDINIKNIKKIINVYQIFYVGENIYPTGWGDFLRGTYFLLEWGNKNNIMVDIHIDHPIKYYLKREFAPLPFVKKQIQFNPSPNLIESEWRNYIKKSPGIQEKYVYTIKYPQDSLPISHINLMKYWLEPIQEITDKTFRILDSLSLSKNEYVVIHVRFGDNVNQNTQLKLSKINKFILAIQSSISLLSSSSQFLLLADSSIIKNYILNNFSFMKAWCVEITHMGEGKITQDQTQSKLHNTMIDFQLIRYSSQIYCFSSYKHGSGFSEWCSKTYQIPYQIHIIQEVPIKYSVHSFL